MVAEDKSYSNIVRDVTGLSKDEMRHLKDDVMQAKDEILSKDSVKQMRDGLEKTLSKENLKQVKDDIQSTLASKERHLKDDITTMSKDGLNKMKDSISSHLPNSGAVRQVKDEVKDAVSNLPSASDAMKHMADMRKAEIWRAGTYGTLAGAATGGAGVYFLNWLRPNNPSLDRFMFRYRMFPLLAVATTSIIGGYYASNKAKMEFTPVNIAKRVADKLK